MAYSTTYIHPTLGVKTEEELRSFYGNNWYQEALHAGFEERKDFAWSNAQQKFMDRFEKSEYCFFEAFNPDVRVEVLKDVFLSLVLIGKHHQWMKDDVDQLAEWFVKNMRGEITKK